MKLFTNWLGDAFLQEHVGLNKKDVFEMLILLFKICLNSPNSVVTLGVLTVMVKSRGG